MNRLYDIVDTMHKEANMLSNAGKLLMNNKATVAGGALGGAYGAYKGSQGENGGLKGALMGGLQGAAGGALIGNVGARVANSKAIKGYKDARTRVLNDARVSDANRGFFSRNFGEGRKQLKAFKQSQQQNLAASKRQYDKIVDLEGAGLLKAKDARNQIDSLMQSNSLTNLSAARDKLIYGGIGAGMAASTGLGLMRAGAESGQGVTNEQRMENLRAKYQQTGSLDAREQRMLTNMMAGRPQGSTAV